MNEQQLFLAIISGLFAGGGFFGAKGLVDRYISQKQDAGIAERTAEQSRQTTMAEATVSMAQRLSEAMIELASETLKTSNANIMQLATGLETHRTESSYHAQSLREGIETNEAMLEKLTIEVHTIYTRLGVLVDHLAKNWDGKL